MPGPAGGNAKATRSSRVVPQITALSQPPRSDLVEPLPKIKQIGLLFHAEWRLRGWVVHAWAHPRRWHRIGACSASAWRYCAQLLVTVVAVAGASTGWAANAPGVIHPLEWPAAAPAAAMDPKIEQFVEQLLGSMSSEEKVGQLIQADIGSIKPDDLHTYKIGSILAGGNSAPGGDVRTTPARWLDLVDEFYRASIAEPSPQHAAIPILFAIDAVHGHSRIPGATVFPHNIGLGAAHDPALMEQIGQATAAEVAATGIDWTFAPTIAVVRDVRWGRTYESYSEDPALVAAYAPAMVSGLQGAVGSAQFLGPGRVLATIKHFLGDGGTLAGRDQSDNQSDERTLRDVDAAGYPPAIAAGALSLMASYSSWQSIKMHANHALLTDVLKGRWRFPGFVVSDWNAQEQIPRCTKFDCPAMLMAGVDMYMAPDSWRQIYASLLDQVQSGQILQQRLDDAVRRILRVKALAGLFGKGAPRERPGAGHFETLGSAGHRAIAREAVRRSLVLLKNNGQLLPLNPHAQILVAGAAADDIGMQCGGWSIDWQGDHNTNADFPGATSIFGGIQAAVAAAGGTAILSPDGSFRQRPAAAIVVYGETPYAEFEGDRETLEFSANNRRHLEILRRLRAAGIPVVSVFISGRPLWVNRELNASDAFVAAWLPGSEGAGIADLLFRQTDGSIRQDFTGRLSFSWPATAMPVTFTDAGVVHGAQFPRGFGMSVRQQTPLRRLAEDPQLPPGMRARDTLFYAGHVAAPWSIYLSDPTAGVRLTTTTAASPGGALSAQLDAALARVTWTGRALGLFTIGGRAADFGALAGEHAAMVLRYRVESPPQQPVRLSMICEAPYAATLPAASSAAPVNWALCGTRAGASLDVTARFVAAPIGSWQTLSIPLACLTSDGAALAHVSAPFTLTTAGAFGVSFAEIRLVRGAGNTACR
jgi:beta-glucosidase